MKVLCVMYGAYIKDNRVVEDCESWVQILTVTSGQVIWPLWGSFLLNWKEWFLTQGGWE